MRSAKKRDGPQISATPSLAVAMGVANRTLPKGGFFVPSFTPRVNTKTLTPIVQVIPAIMHRLMVKALRSGCADDVAEFLIHHLTRSNFSKRKSLFERRRRDE